MSTFSLILLYTSLVLSNLLGRDFMKPLKEQISITIDNDVLMLIRAEAEKDDRSLSQYINIVLKEHLKSKNSSNDS